MRYCLVHVRTGKRILFMNKSEFHSWIFQHKIFFTPLYLSLFRVHRVRMNSVAYYTLLDSICTLKEYILKHKL